MFKVKRKKIKGFTLIELLAVIVILAIVALIAVPTIMNIINKANKSAFKDSAYGIVNAGELYFAERQLEPNGMLEDVTITLPNEKLGLKGDIPKGSITITREGDIALAVYNDRYCVTKGFDDTDITITEDYEECKNPGELEPIMTSENSCVTSGICSEADILAGIKVNVKVNDTENYDFYVIADTGTEVTLIMDSNLEDNVEWINADDYATANADDNTSCSYTACNDEGPVTAVATLKTRTAGWTNIPEKEYTYSDDGGGNKYTAFTETMRTRMLTYTEATTFGCTSSCPSWLYVNLYNTGDSTTDANGKYKYGYWTSAARASDSNCAHSVHFHGKIAISNLYATNFGLRPVITISK